MNESFQDEQLLAVSFDLEECIEMTREIINDILDDEEESEKFNYTRGYSEEFVEAMISDLEQSREKISEKKKLAKTKSTGVIASLKDKVHLFAEFSQDVVALELKPIKERYDMEEGTKLPDPEDVIGTSAHHAGLLFLERALINDFWEHSWFPEESPPEFSYRMLIARIQRERMCLFRVSEPPSVKEDEPLVGPRFDNLKNLFITEDGVKVRFTSDIHFLIFKTVYDRGEISFSELIENIPAWQRKGSGTDENIKTCRNRINQAFGSAGLYGDEYKLAIRKRHLLFKKNLNQ